VGAPKLVQKRNSETMTEEPTKEDYDKPSQISEEVLLSVVRELRRRDSIANVDCKITMPDPFWVKHPILETPEKALVPDSYLKKPLNTKVPIVIIDAQFDFMHEGKLI
jgi:hypothetical protein